MTKQAVLVLGMHRSGTSVVAAGGEALGFNLGKNRADWESDDNPKGYFENVKVTLFNDRLLRYLGGRWDNPLFYGQTALAAKSTKELEPWYREALAIMDEEFGLGSSLLIKDPRISLLLPFWHEALARFGFQKNEIYHVYVLRSPLEVALSQQKRTKTDPNRYSVGAELEETILVWASYMYQALECAVSEHNILVHYPDFVDKVVPQMKRLAVFVDSVPEPKNLASFAATFVDPKLYRNKGSTRASGKESHTMKFANNFYVKIQRFSKMDRFKSNDLNSLGDSSAPVQECLQYFQAFSNRVSSSLDRVSELSYDMVVAQRWNEVLKRRNEESRRNNEKLRRNNEELRKDIAELREEREALQETLSRIYRSRIWRWTSPLRKVLAHLGFADW